MKFAKRLTLASMAAVAAMGVGSVGIAPAEEKTVLCEVMETPCAGKNTYPAETEIVANSSLVELKLELTSQNIQTMTCEESEMIAETKEEKGQPQLKGEVTSMSLAGCTTSGVSCLAAAVQLPWQMSLLHALSQGDGAMEWYEHTLGQPGINVACLTFDCTLKVKEEGQEGREVGALGVLGGSPATLKAKQVELKPKGPNCTLPFQGEVKQGFLDADYEVTKPNPMFVEHQ